VTTIATRPAPVETAPVPPAAQPPSPVTRQRRRPLRPGAVALDVSLYVTLLVAVVVMAMPLLWTVLGSFKNVVEINAVPMVWFPSQLDWSNYAAVFDAIPLARMALNSLLVTAIGTTLKVLLGITCAYALVFVEVPGRRFVFLLVLFTLLIPGQITIIPNYVLIAGLDWTNTYQGIIVPGLASAFGTFLFRQQFQQLPRSILEAAEVDGAGHFRRLFQLVVPMSSPTIAAVVIVTVVAEWNDYLWPSLVARTPDHMTLPVGLTHLQDLEGVQNWGVLMAGATIVTIPMLLMFLLLQRRMIAGLTAGAVTG